MCLITKQNRAKIAKEDIVCWMIAMKKKNGEIVTFFQEEKITPCMKSELILDRSWLTGKTEINIGLHSLPTRAKARELRDIVLNHYVGYPVIVLNCVIPKGSRYYEGTFNLWDGEFVSKSYASNKRNLVNFLKK